MRQKHPETLATDMGTYTRSESNGTVRVAKGYAYRDSLRGVRLRTHLARGDVFGLRKEDSSQTKAVQYRQ